MAGCWFNETGLKIINYLIAFFPIDNLQLRLWL